MPIDTSDMLAVHKVFRLAFRDAPLTFGRAEGPTQLEAVGSFYETVLDFLHLHHETEDALMFPVLALRCPAEAALLARMEAQHQGVSSTLARAEGLLGAWRTSPSGRKRAEVIPAMSDLGAAFEAHVDEEEAHVLPLAAEHITPEEWAALPRHALAHYKGDRAWLLQGLVREHMTESHLAHMTKNMPPPVLEAWITTGSRMFADLMAKMPVIRSTKVSPAGDSPFDGA